MAGKRSLKIFAVVVALMGLAVAAMLLLAWSRSRGLEGRVAALRADGHPVSLADLRSEPVPADENAAAILEQASSEIRALVEKLSEIVLRTGFPDRPLSDDDRQAIEAAWQAHPQVIPLLYQAVESGYRPQIDGSASLEQFQEANLQRRKQARSIARVLAYHADWNSAQGKPDEALQSCLVLFRFCRQLDREPTMIGHLVSLACRAMAVESTNRALQQGETSERLRQELETELSRHDLTEAYRQALRTERAYGLEMYRNGFPLGMRLFQGADAHRYLDLLERALAEADRPYWELAAGGTTSSGPSTPAALMAPAVEQAREATEGTRARLRCLRVLNALIARADAIADIPLADLSLPEEVTTDPFTGRSLHVRKTDAGWLIYSEGPNRQDDGGDIQEQLDIGLGPPRSAD